MKIYVVPQFVILNNSSDNAVVQNKNGISQLTDKNINLVLIFIKKEF